MPKVSAEYSEARRVQIIDAAYRCFARKGFHLTTMREIIQEVQLSPGAIYHYFRSKDEIIAASFEHDLQRSSGSFQQALDETDSMVALEKLIGFFFAGLASAVALGANRVNIQGWSEALLNPKLHEAITGAFKRYRALLAQLIRQAQQRGVVSPEIDPEAAARIILSLYLGLELQSAWEPQDVDIGEYTKAVNRLLQGTFRQNR